MIGCRLPMITFSMLATGELFGDGGYVGLGHDVLKKDGKPAR